MCALRTPGYPSPPLPTSRPPLATQLFTDDITQRGGDSRPRRPPPPQPVYGTKYEGDKQYRYMSLYKMGRALLEKKENLKILSLVILPMVGINTLLNVQFRGRWGMM